MHRAKGLVVFDVALDDYRLVHGTSLYTFCLLADYICTCRWAWRTTPKNYAKNRPSKCTCRVDGLVVATLLYPPAFCDCDGSKFSWWYSLNDSANINTTSFWILSSSTLMLILCVCNGGPRNFQWERSKKLITSTTPILVKPRQLLVKFRTNTHTIDLIQWHHLITDYLSNGRDSLPGCHTTCKWQNCGRSLSSNMLSPVFSSQSRMGGVMNTSWTFLELLLAVLIRQWNEVQMCWGNNGWFWLHVPLTSVLLSPRPPSVLNGCQYLLRGGGMLEAISTPWYKRMG